jgi:membrane protein YdbS with pleckstrin-like domain
MKHIPNIQFTPPEADRRVLLWISIFLMIPFWLLLAFFCLVFWSGVFTDSWDTKRFVIAVALTALVAFGIPFQLVRYVRELRQLRASRREL